MRSLIVHKLIPKRVFRHAESTGGINGWEIPTSKFRQTEGANRIHLSKNLQWENFCTSEGRRIKEIFHTGLRKTGVKTLLLHRNKPKGILGHAASAGEIHGVKMPTSLFCSKG